MADKMTVGDKKRLGVVIINYKTPELTLECIRSLRDQLDVTIDHIVVVDNNSGEEDVQRINHGIKQEGLAELVTLRISPVNKGFSSGNNIGIKAMDAKYYLLANADTLFRPGAIPQLLEAAEEFPEAGIISPRLEWPDGEPQVSCFRYYSPFSEIINAAGTGLVTGILKKFDVPLQTVEYQTKPDWTSFACVLIRQEVFDTVGLLDEGYFMYYEDVDYCRRAKQAGFEIINWPFAHVIHLRGQSSGIKKLHRDKKRLPAYHYQSRSRYYTKFYGTSGLLISNLCWLAGRTVSLFRELLGKSRTVPEYQYLDIWKK